MRKLFISLACIFMALALWCIEDEIQTLRWDYEFVHHMKDCNRSEVCH